MTTKGDSDRVVGVGVVDDEGPGLDVQVYAYRDGQGAEGGDPARRPRQVRLARLRPGQRCEVEIVVGRLHTEYRARVDGRLLGVSFVNNAYPPPMLFAVAGPHAANGASSPHAADDLTFFLDRR